MPTSAPPREVLVQLTQDVRAGLSGAVKTLPSKYLYDAIGSALFEVLTLLPEYGVTRAETRVLARCAEALAEHLPGPRDVIELGCGSGKKTRDLLSTLARRGSIVYRPIEISGAALAACARAMADLPGVRFDGIEDDYLNGLRRARAAGPADTPLTVMFLGSTIGNFNTDEATAFLGSLRAILRPGDTLLLGTDLVKPVAQLLAAYDDPIGATAAFNLNLLARLNRELGADFDLRHFEHEARYDDGQRSIQMHLRSTCRQRVTLPAADLSVEFEEGETIWTESSHKYRLEDVATLGAAGGFRQIASWQDEEWPFAETLFEAV